MAYSSYGIFSTNSSVTCHTQFCLTLDLVFSRIFRISEIFEKKEFGHVFEELVGKVQYYVPD